LWQPVKKKSKRWIADSFCTANSLIHLFDFFFYSSGYRQAGYYFQAFVLFVSLWFFPRVEIFLTGAKKSSPTCHQLIFFASKKTDKQEKIDLVEQLSRIQDFFLMVRVLR
jgi:hypothetical protein